MPQPLISKCWSWPVLWRPTTPLGNNTKNEVLFIIGDWNAKGGIQEIPGIPGKFGRGEQNEAEQRLTAFCQENMLLIENTLFQQYKRQLYTWTSSDGQYQHQIEFILCSQRWDFPGKNTGVGCHFLLQEIFLTQGLNPGLLHCRQMLYHLSCQESPKMKKLYVVSKNKIGSWLWLRSWTPYCQIQT